MVGTGNFAQLDAWHVLPTLNQGNLSQVVDLFLGRIPKKDLRLQRYEDGFRLDRGETRRIATLVTCLAEHFGYASELDGRIESIGARHATLAELAAFFYAHKKPGVIFPAEAHYALGSATKGYDSQTEKVVDWIPMIYLMGEFTLNEERVLHGRSLRMRRGDSVLVVIDRPDSALLHRACKRCPAS